MDGITSTKIGSTEKKGGNNKMFKDQLKNC